ncbi:hypothetical protein [Streptomyces sp. NPDC047928]|uniref:hypothetical protein n=1 Tax=unclassified Streptomyces TaxID=2593676 RepID=UPI003715FCC0
MPDRRRRTAIHLLPRERQSTDDNNPFAPPPEGRPDQPWQPRRPDNGGSDGGGGTGDGRGGNGRGGDDHGSGASGQDRDRPSWGSQWSPRQPGRSSGGFGGRPQGDQQGGPGGGQSGPQPRWDPTDPAQRRARYALLSGMWAFFFAVFDLPEIALLLGSLALYWGISSLRAKSRTAQQAAVTGTTPPGGGPAGASPGRPQTTAAVSGLVTAGLALMIVATTFTIQLVYRDFYTCVDDALTKDGQLSCNELLPDPLRDVFGVKE